MGEARYDGIAEWYDAEFATNRLALLTETTNRFNGDTYGHNQRSPAELTVQVVRDDHETMREGHADAFHNPKYDPP